MLEMQLHGSLRQLDSKKTAKRPLDIYIFNIQRLEGNTFNSHYEQLKYLESLGFNVNPLKKHCIRNRVSNKRSRKNWWYKRKPWVWNRWCCNKSR